MKQIIKVLGKEIRLQGRLVRMAQLEGDTYEYLSEPQGMLAALQECGTRIDVFTFVQRIVDASTKYDFPMETDNFAALPLTTFDDWWKQLRPEARNRGRRAEKRGVVVREVPLDDHLVKSIWEIYNESPVRQGRAFPHYGKDLKAVYDVEATFMDHSFFIGAYFEDKLIAFTKATMDEHRTQANMMNFLATIEHRDKAPANALIAQAVRSCVERGVSYLLYQHYSYGNKERDGLMRFKEVNGFQRFDVPRYYVPLTAVGKLALRWGLHRRAVDQIPEPVGRRLRDLRSAWHARRLGTARATR